MGLDMYLNKMPRYKNINAEQINLIEDYFSYKKEKKNGNKYANCTFKEWCGHEENELPNMETIEWFKPFYITKYFEFDIKHEYGYDRIMDEVGYWRKANHIHNWFVNNVQNGEDDCNYHKEVTKEILIDLLKTCLEVVYSCELIDSKDGKYVKDSSIAEKLLPTTSGFFFGGTDYDEWYVQDIKNTIDIIINILATTDFEKEMIYYVSSW